MAQLAPHPHMIRSKEITKPTCAPISELQSDISIMTQAGFRAIEKKSYIDKVFRFFISFSIPRVWSLFICKGNKYSEIIS